MASTDQFLLKWEHHSSTFAETLTQLNKTHEYSDATVGCSSALYPVHKIVLGACSQYFSEIFESTSGKHPIIILKDIASDVFEVLLSFMYLGQVEVKQEKLPDILSAAECLQIKGLAVTDTNSGTDLEDTTTSSEVAHHAHNKPISRKRFQKEKVSPCSNFSTASKRMRREPVLALNLEQQEGPSSRDHFRTEVCSASQISLNAAKLTTPLQVEAIHSEHSEDTDPYNDDTPLTCCNSKTKTNEISNSCADEKLQTPLLQQPSETEAESRTIALNSSFKDSSTDVFEEVSIEEVKAEIQDTSQGLLTQTNDKSTSQQQVSSQPQILSQPHALSKPKGSSWKQAQSQQPHQESPHDTREGCRGSLQWTTPADTEYGEDSSDVNTSTDWGADSSWDTDPVSTELDASPRDHDAEECSQAGPDCVVEELQIKQEAEDLPGEDAFHDQEPSHLMQVPTDCGRMFLPTHGIFQTLHPNCNTSVNITNNMTSSHNIPLRTSTITVTRNFHKTSPSSHPSRSSFGAGSSSSSSSWASKPSARSSGKKSSAMRTSAVITKLPDFSPILQPFLLGLVLSEQERQILELQFREEVVRFLDSENLNVTHHAGGNSRWWYHAFGRKLYERYPNIQWTQGPTNKSAAQETRKRPQEPWTFAMRKLSTFRKSRRFNAKRRLCKAIAQLTAGNEPLP